MLRPLPTIYGVPCSLKSRRLRGAIRLVLGRIRRRAPEEFERLRTRVREIAALPESVEAAGVEGGWKSDEPGGGFFTSPGVVALTDRARNIIATVAHELGHACTRKEDVERHGGTVLGARWALEMCADLYAYRWGFGRRIGQDRRIRDWRHHGPAPGRMLLREDEGLVYRYRVTRSFYVPLIQIETPDGQVVETRAQIEESRCRGWEQLPAKLKRGRRRPR